MESIAYEAESRVEESHWWFVGRRYLFSKLLLQSGVTLSDGVLDIGSSTGTNLRMLRDLDFRKVRGLDCSPHAIRLCAEKGLGPVDHGDIGTLHYENELFSAVLSTDVLEHLDDDRAALKEIHRVLKPGGIVLITAPAFKSLWGKQDEISLHKRRYSLSELRARVGQAGFTVERAFYFNFILFPFIWVARQLLRRFAIPIESENDLNSPFINAVLKLVFLVDLHLAPALKPPFGVSALVVAKKPRIAS